MDEFWSVAPASFRTYALRFVGKYLSAMKEDIPCAVLKRYRKLWESRRSQFGQPESNVDISEMAAFGEWFISGKLPEEWIFNQLKDVLRLTGGVIEQEEMVAEGLSDFASKHPVDVLNCLKLILEGIRQEWRRDALKKSARRIISSCIRSGEPRAALPAKRLAEELISKDQWFDLRDLLHPNLGQGLTEQELK
ncbi:MAG: hypothetical protein J7M19_00630 [Planctomycetes bacterium]|nr:hypothetical protein [Planctomycetota bacterium]